MLLFRPSLTSSFCQILSRSMSAWYAITFAQSFIQSMAHSAADLFIGPLYWSLTHSLMRSAVQSLN